MKVDSQVRFLNQEGGGRVTGFKGGKCVVVDDDGMEWVMPMNEVVEVTLSHIDEVKKISTKTKMPAKNRPSSTQKKALKTGGKGIKAKVIDLHQNALNEHSRNMNSVDVHELQLRTIVNAIESEKSNHGLQITFIHGNGEGVLRAELIKILNKYKSVCSYEDAPFNIYGYQGAIKVIIR